MKLFQYLLWVLFIAAIVWMGGSVIYVTELARRNEIRSLYNQSKLATQESKIAVLETKSHEHPGSKPVSDPQPEKPFYTLDEMRAKH